MDPTDIAILTPYNAQAAEISKRLAQLGVAGVTVCSITKSQGEADSGVGPVEGGAGSPSQGPHCTLAPQGASGATCC